MGAKMQLRSRSVEDEPRFVVGMDAHARKLAVSVWDWSDRFNACLHREIKTSMRWSRRTSGTSTSTRSR